MRFAELVKLELETARRAHQPINSAHEGYAVILEELDELKAIVWKRTHNHPDMLKELKQAAAMCQRMAEDLGLVKDQPNRE